jgi:hypothetical protein
MDSENTHKATYHSRLAKQGGSPKPPVLCCR